MGSGECRPPRCKRRDSIHSSYPGPPEPTVISRYFADLDPEDEELHEFRKHLAAAFATKKRQRTVVHLHNWQRDQDPKVKEYEDQQMRKNTGKTQAEWEEFVEMMSDKAWDDCKVELRKVTESARAHRKKHATF